MADRLNPGDELREGQSITSRNGGYSLLQQDDGNLVLYRSRDGRALWASGTNGMAVRTTIMQRDGNLVIYGFPQALWASGTDGHPNSVCFMQDDGNLVIYEPWQYVWDTGTNQ